MNYRFVLAAVLIGAMPLGTLPDEVVKLPHVPSDPTPPRKTSAQPSFGDDWPAGPGREITGALCGSCHSLAIVKQQGLSRSDWDELLDWMVEEQGMVRLGPTNRTNILNYLSIHFGVPRN